MNTPVPDLEEQLHDALHGRVDALDQAPLSFTDVRHRARRIQRRRTMAAGAGIAAALALLVPAGQAVTDAFPKSETPPATNVPDVPDRKGPVTIDPAGAPEGDAARVPLIVVGDRQLLTPGYTEDLPHGYEQIGPYTDGWVAVRNDQGVRSLDFLGPDFSVQEGNSPTSNLTIRQDGRRFAWAEYDGTRWRIIQSEADPQEEWIYTDLPTGPREAEVRTVGFLPGDEVVAAQIDPTDGSETGMIATRQGTIEPITGFIHLASSSPVTGLVAGLISQDGANTCSAAKDVRSGADGFVWETCDHQVGPFSPGGTHVVGLAEYFDGFGSPTLSVLDASTGEPVLDFEVAPARNQPVAVAPEVVWEDDETMLAVVTVGDQQYVVRLGLDGSVERVAGPTSIPEAAGVAYRLSPAAVD